jgi:hypothetical protein
MELSLQLVLEIVLSGWLISAMLVAIMLQVASRPSPGFAAPLPDPTDDSYRFGVAGSVAFPASVAADTAGAQGGRRFNASPG